MVSDDPFSEVACEEVKDASFSPRKQYNVMEGKSPVNVAIV